MTSNLTRLTKLNHLLNQHLRIRIERNIRLAEDGWWQSGHFREIVHRHQYVLRTVL